ncbi:hypothetical protein G3T14_18020 [Methylobacterium sp. BTF04]|nr:hypothetical protein [Methylobacterium sp. BTF04]
MNQKHGNIGLTRRHCVGLGIASVAAAPAWAAQLAPEPPARVALGGFDAVSYFLGGQNSPETGLAAFEYSWSGRTWRFAHPANREAFRAEPAIYAPRLGGFDPLGVIEGRFVNTDPLIFLLVPGPDGSRLYLFRSTANRAAFAADADLPGQAEARWPDLRRSPDADPAE